mmetsp:Transcript_16915/g.43435  ORF Transcript_16915/g.43435 Transcript_16915/m.43435 type:complete len:105 (+) Transcript_16915:190-504(+)
MTKRSSHEPARTATGPSWPNLLARDMRACAVRCDLRYGTCIKPLMNALVSSIAQCTCDAGGQACATQLQELCLGEAPSRNISPNSHALCPRVRPRELAEMPSSS